LGVSPFQKGAFGGYPLSKRGFWGLASFKKGLLGVSPFQKGAFGG